MLRRFAIALASFVALFAAAHASAQCRDCDWSYVVDCYECVDTTASASVLCTIEDNGQKCRLEGSCVGYDPWCRHYPETCPENPLRETPTLRGEWQLVAVDVERVKPSRSRKRHS